MVVGQNFTGELTPTAARPHPAAPAAVRPVGQGGHAPGRAGPPRVEGRLPAADPDRHRAHLALNTEVPYRVYKLDDGKTVRFTFRTERNEYWGIQETDWDDAPALADKNLSQVIRGRQYDFYFNGPHLHMVVLRAGGASYWVVNTLLDSMSNETMLAIAKGLKPLHK